MATALPTSRPRQADREQGGADADPAAIPTRVATDGLPDPEAPPPEADAPIDALVLTVAGQRLARVVADIHRAARLDTVLRETTPDLLELFEAERMSVCAVDREQRTFYWKFLDVDTIRQLRLPVDPTSIDGYVVRTGGRLNIADAHDPAELAAIHPELTFDAGSDRLARHFTRQILAVPVMHDPQRVMGILKLVNRRRGRRFTGEDERHAAEIARALATTFEAFDPLARRRAGKFDYLLVQDLLTPDELRAAMAEARRQRTDVESILLSRFRIPKDDLGVALSLFYRCPFLAFSERLVIDREVLRVARLDYLRANAWVPLARRHATIDVLIDNPHDVQRVDHIKRLFAGASIRFFVGLRQDVLRFIDRAASGADLHTSVSSILGELASDVAVGDEASGDEADLNDSAIVRLVHQLIIDAHDAGASDVHIEPRGGRQDTLIRFRVDGRCSAYQRVPPGLRRALGARVKIMAGLDIAERRRPQDGKIRLRLPDHELELRVATLPTADDNEDVAIRFVRSDAPLGIGGLGLAERNLREIKRLISQPHGLILCVGPTGSGKTTTLHALIGVLNTPDRRILTAEDPVEITQEGLRQVQVQPRIGLTFAAVLRAFLRADPDVMMVGEMRDHETAATAIEAALTGHLVLSTLHTNSAVDTVIRLLDMGVDPFTFADVMLGVLAQRLVRRICLDCTEAYHPPVEVYDEMADLYGRPDFRRLDVPYDERFRLARGRGCASCGHAGYRGRTAIHELLVGSAEIKRLIRTRAGVAEILAHAKAEGMTTLAQDGIAKTLRGDTDLHQVRAAAAN